jgi:hypothetical protein
MVCLIKLVSLGLFVSNTRVAGLTLIDRRTCWRNTAKNTALIIGGIFPTAAWSAVAETSSVIESRLSADILKQPPTSSAKQNGISNTYDFPDFLEGRWQTTQTLTNVASPLGLNYIGGPNGLESIAEKSLAEFRQRLNKPVELELRYTSTKWGVAEDRLYNTRQRLDGFADRSVVASADYTNTGASNRAAVLAQGGTETDPLETVLVRFKGPAAQKVFVTSHRGEYLSDTSWVGCEGQRSIFALTNANTAPPIFTVRYQC